MRVLILGAGIAGPTLAYWLQRAGYRPTLVESTPQLRQGGHLVDFWGAGFDIAERMGIVPRLMHEGYRIQELREVDADGKKITGLDPGRVVDKVGGRYVSIARSDLAAAIYDALDENVETIFGDTIEALDDDGHRVLVEFSHHPPREFDLVVGADGLHSRVRSLAFGPEHQFELPLGITVAALELVGYRRRDDLVAVTHTAVGAQTLRVSLRDDTTLVLFTFRHAGAIPEDISAQHKLLRHRLGHIGGEVPSILDQLAEAKTFYLDRASQIRMPSWSTGRMALVGDAAAAPSLLAGQGAALAMVEAYILATKLRDTDGDHTQAFTAYQHHLDAVIRTKQDAARNLGTAFAPSNRTKLFLRNTALRFMGLPFVADLVMGRSLRDPIELPQW